MLGYYGPGGSACSRCLSERGLIPSYDGGTRDLEPRGRRRLIRLIVSIPEIVLIGSSSAMLIAIVDDDAGVRTSLNSLLRSTGTANASFANGPELLASRILDQVTCVVTDLHMPEMTGLELQAELMRKNFRGVVIFMTAYPTEAVRTQAMANGARAFLTKPIDPDELLDSIETAHR